MLLIQKFLKELKEWMGPPSPEKNVANSRSLQVAQNICRETFIPKRSGGFSTINQKRLKRYFPVDRKKEKIPSLEILRSAFLDTRLNGKHLNLLAALVICCEQNAGIHPFHFTRRKLMLLSKVRSISTYHRYLKELQEFRYIEYFPSYHPKMGSQLYFIIQ